MGVPRRIHQIWIHHDDIPLHKYPIEHIQSWKKHHPSWEYKLWTKDECDILIHKYFPEVKEQYEKAQYVVKSDICRIGILILCGGIYADLDTECFKSFDSLVDDINVTIKNNSNSFFMTPRDATYLKKFMEYLSNNHNVHQPIRYGGPMGIVNFEKQYDGNLDDIMRNEGAYCEKNGLKHENAYAVHYYRKNWMQPYVVVGSAPYVSQWLKKNKKELMKHRAEMCPVNNAWALFDPKEISIWTYPCDLPQRGTLIPTDEQRKEIPDIREFMPKFYRRTYNNVSNRNAITWVKSFTMMIDTVYMLIDHDRAKKVYIIGCDMIYKNDKSDFFYANASNCKGAADPLRKGKALLIKELNKLYEYAKKHNVEIRNLSEQADTLLPFQRLKL
jgi:hypothetical protein